MKAATSTQAADLKRLQTRRKQIVRELADLEREIAGAEKQLARLDVPAVIVEQADRLAA